MGFLDRLFKKKKDVAGAGKSEAKNVKGASEAGKAVSKAKDVGVPAKCKPEGACSYGKSRLGIAMTKAMATLDEREKAGKIKPASAGAFRGRINALKPMIDKEEESGLIQIAQIIGSINRSV